MFSDQATFATIGANTEVTEEELKLSAVAPRVTEHDVIDAIASEHYFTALEGAYGNGGNGTYSPDWEVPRSIFALGLMTICVLVLKNGFTVLGHSACADPNNFNVEIGQRLAKKDAVSKVWPLLGYVLKNELAKKAQEEQLTWLDRLKTEQAELNIKMVKLSAFIRDYGSQLDPKVKKDLEDQYMAMGQYAGVLKRRVDSSVTAQ